MGSCTPQVQDYAWLGEDNVYITLLQKRVVIVNCDVTVCDDVFARWRM